MIRLPSDLFRTVLENPSEDLPRLILADWLEEHGETDRAEFIRVQCELATVPQKPAPCQHPDMPQHVPVLTCPWCTWLMRYSDREIILSSRERELEAIAADWYVDMIEAMGYTTERATQPHRYKGHGTIGIHYGNVTLTCDWHRGFVDEVQCRIADWICVGHIIVQHQPIEHVKFTGLAPINVRHLHTKGGATSESWAWFRHAYGESQSTIPDVLMAIIWNQIKTDGLSPIPYRIDFPSKECAIEALSQAAITYARTLAGWFFEI